MALPNLNVSNRTGLNIRIDGPYWGCRTFIASRLAGNTQSRTSSKIAHRSRVKGEKELAEIYNALIFVCVQPFDHTVRGALSPVHTSRTAAGIGNSGTFLKPRFEGCARQPPGQEAHSANIFRKECKDCNEVRKPSCPAPHIQSSEAIVTSQP